MSLNSSASFRSFVRRFRRYKSDAIARNRFSVDTSLASGLEPANFCTIKSKIKNYLRVSDDRRAANFWVLLHFIKIVSSLDMLKVSERMRNDKILVCCMRKIKMKRCIFFQFCFLVVGLMSTACLAAPSASAESNADAESTPQQYADLLAANALAQAAVEPAYVDEAIPTVVNTQFHAQSELGEYSYGYSNPTSSKFETKSADGTVEGSYSYLSPDGRVITNNYVSQPGFGFKSSLAPANGEEAILVDPALVADVPAAIPAIDPVVADIGAAIVDVYDNEPIAPVAPVADPYVPLQVHEAVPSDHAVDPYVVEEHHPVAAPTHIVHHEAPAPIAPQPNLIHHAVEHHQHVEPVVYEAEPVVYEAAPVYALEPAPAVVHHAEHHVVAHPEPVVHHEEHFVHHEPVVQHDPYVVPEPVVKPYVAHEPYVAPEPVVKPYIAPEPVVKPYVAPEPVVVHHPKTIVHHPAPPVVHHKKTYHYNKPAPAVVHHHRKPYTSYSKPVVKSLPSRKSYGYRRSYSPYKSYGRHHYRRGSYGRRYGRYGGYSHRRHYY